MLRVVQDQHYRVSLDTSRVTYRLDGAPFGGPGKLLKAAQYGASSSWVSAAALAHKAKIVSDGVMAAIDLLVQRGTKGFPSKVEVVRQIAAAALNGPNPATDALVTLATALHIGGVEFPLDGLEAELKEARATAEAIEPISFYTWSEELQRIFRQDRTLQTALMPEDASRLAEIIRGDPKLLRSYRKLLKLATRLAAPLDAPTVLEKGEEQRLFPPFRSMETALLLAMYGTSLVPPDFQLIDELLARLRAGTLSLSPTEDGGWYEHEQHALSILVTPEQSPEAARLAYGERYRAYLDDFFRALLALARETHAKQLGRAGAGAAGPRELPIYVEPELTVEPLIEFYERKAKSLEFVSDLLRTTFGATALSKVHGLRENGEAPSAVLSELSHLISLFRGAASLSAREIGWEGYLQQGEAIEALQLWRMQPDPDLLIDTRMMLPVFFDRGRCLTKAWCVLGYEVRTVVVTFDREPEVLGIETVTAIPPPRRGGRSLKQILSDRKNGMEPERVTPPPVRFVGQAAEVLLPVLAEVYVEKVMNRDEFRSFCNQFETKDELLDKLRASR
jgi:hypothetical protein